MVGSLDRLEANQEPPCRICTHLTPPAAFNPRILESCYKSPVTKRRECCEPRRCNAKVGTDLKYEFNSRSYNVDRVVNKIQELKRNVRDFDCHDETNKSPQKNLPESLPEARINDVKDARYVVISCLRELEKVKTFLEDENSWWKILKGRTVDCCQQKMPHLHGVLDGSSVTLILLEESTDEAPHRFVTTLKEKNNVAGSGFETCSKELTSEVKKTEQCMNYRLEHTDKYANSYTIPHYNLDMKSALIEVTSTDSHEPTQRYVRRAVTSEQSIVASEFWKEVQEDENDEYQKAKIPERSNSDEYQRAKTPERTYRSKETRDDIQYEDKEKRIVVPPRGIQYSQNSQTTFEDPFKLREAFNSENTRSKHITNDFESNVDLNTEIPSRNVSSHKPRTKTIIERGVRCIQNKFPTKISRTKSRD